MPKMSYLPISVDPFASDTIYYMHIRSSKYLAAGVTPWTLPAAVNFPDALAGTPSRLIYDCPYMVDTSNLTSRPCTLYDTTAAAGLTRVTTAPSSGQYRLVIDTSSKRQCAIEFHSGAVGHVIDFDFYSTGSVITSELANDLNWGLKRFQPIFGLVPSNNVGDLVNDLDFTAGYAIDSTYNYLITVGALTKRLDATFTAGTNQGMLDTGSKANSTVYYIYAIGKTTNYNSGDLLASTSATSPTMPSGWDIKRLIGICQTNGSGNIYRGKWWREGSAIHFRFRTFVADLPTTALSAGDNRRLLTTIAPIGSFGNYIFKCYDEAHTSVYLTFGSTFEEDVKPTNMDNSLILTDGNGAVVFNENETIEVDSSRQIFYRADVPEELVLAIGCAGYYYILA